MSSNFSIISPDWPAPSSVHALTTLIEGGVSLGPYASLNLAAHVGDDIQSVIENRRILREKTNLPSEPFWLTQVHGTDVVIVDSRLQGNDEFSVVADASVTFEKNKICAVLTADCLPILLCNKQGDRVAAVHAGWRGLAAGVIESAVLALEPTKREDLMAWLGPAIGPNAFEVGQDVLDAFNRKQDLKAFVKNDKNKEKNKWYADIYQLARFRLNALGIQAVYGGEFCTYSEPNRFFSYRRSPKTGRFASLVWFT